MSQSKIIKIILVAIILVAVFWGSKTVENYFQDTIGYITNYMDGGKWGSMVIFVALAVLSVMLVSFSSIWLVPIASALWGNQMTLAMLLGGWLLGSIFSYLIGKYAGYPIVRKIISEEKINNYSSIFSRARGSFSLIMLSRFVLPSEIPGYLLGMARYPFFKYLLATTISEIPYAFAVVYFIDAVLRKNAIVLLVWGVIWVSFAFLTVRMYKKITGA
ncbi:MAG: VTT domain-containing protein [Candidatus Sungiibacteriota bacterium]